MHPVTVLIPHLSVTHHCWLYANTIAAAGLLVYRSPMLRDTDKIYRPVADFLRHNRMAAVFRARIPDPSMMMAHADLTIYTPLQKPHQEIDV